VRNISDSRFVETARQLSRVEGIFCGGSTGTNCARRCRSRAKPMMDAIIVFIVCDTGEHYLFEIPSDEWMKEKNACSNHTKLPPACSAKRK